MSGPMTTGEIEDVISSIRRLVADAEVTASPDGRQNGSRLVLTSDYRIAGTPEAATADGEAGGGTFGNAAGRADLESSVAELEAALAATAGKWRDEEPRPVPGEDGIAPSGPLRLGPDGDADEAPAAWDVSADTATDGPAAGDGEADDPAEPGVIRGVIPGAAPGAVIVDLHPGADAPEAEDAPDDEAGGEVDAWEPAERPAPGFRRLYPEMADIAAAGAAAGFGRRAGPRGPAVDGAADRAADEADGAAEPGPGNVAKPDAEALLDEDELRQLVAEVLREELKGALGERITRNVRKLVRREIAQALSSMELD